MASIFNKKLSFRNKIMRNRVRYQKESKVKRKETDKWTICRN